MYAFLMDTHIGVNLPNIDFLKSLNEFLGIIKKQEEECHAIFVCGDLFEHKLSIEEAKFASVFLANLVCNKAMKDGGNIPVHFIHGTYSHDREQYEMFMPLLEKIPGTDVYYINETMSSKLPNGTRVLYLPQAYGHNVSYDEWFDKEYDIIVGHGAISSLTKAPCPTTNYDILHSAEQLGSISKICVFGHYHAYTEFGDNVYYGGPWLRWKYGEDEPRKFFFCNDNFEVFTEPNPFALEYKTIEIHSPEELREHISKDITTPHRFVIEVNEEDIQTYHSIMNINKNNTNISYKVTSIKKEKPLPEDTVISPVKNIVEPVPAMISYIKDKYGIDCSKEIHEYEAKINKEESK